MRRLLLFTLLLACPLAVLSKDPNAEPLKQAAAARKHNVQASAPTVHAAKTNLDLTAGGEELLTGPASPEMLFYIRVFEIDMTRVRKEKIELPKVLRGGQANAGPAKNERLQTGSLKLVDDDRELVAQLEELCKQGVAALIAEPTLATTIGRKCSFNVGNEFPVVTEGPNGVSINYQRFGTEVTLDPQQWRKDGLNTTVKIRLSDVDAKTKAALARHEFPIDKPQLSVREVDLDLTLLPSQTAVCFNLTQDRDFAIGPELKPGEPKPELSELRHQIETFCLIRTESARFATHPFPVKLTR